MITGEGSRTNMNKSIILTAIVTALIIGPLVYFFASYEFSLKVKDQAAVTYSLPTPTIESEAIPTVTAQITTTSEKSDTELIKEAFSKKYSKAVNDVSV